MTFGELQLSIRAKGLKQHAGHGWQGRVREQLVKNGSKKKPAIGRFFLKIREYQLNLRILSVAINKNRPANSDKPNKLIAGTGIVEIGITSPPRPAE